MRGRNSTFTDIALQTNLLSISTLECRPVLQLTRKKLNRWFIDSNGKHISPLENPLDTPSHCKERKQWAMNNYGLFTYPLTPIAFLDEKWFCRVNRRRKSKFLPAPSSSSDTPNCVSRRKCFPVGFSLKKLCLWAL